MGLSMASALQYFFAISMLCIGIFECAIFQDGKCITEEPCFDLTVMAGYAHSVSKDVIAGDGEKILLKHSSFDKIRKKKILHSCVLQKIIDLFHDVLIETEGKSLVKDNENNHSELINIMDQLRNCVYEVKGKCNKLLRDLGWPDKKTRKTTTSPTTTSEKEMSAKQLAVLQLQKLMNAREELKNVHVQERVMDELKTLHLYMPGKGFRKNTND